MENLINQIWDFVGYGCVVFIIARYLFLEFKEQERKSNGF